MRYGTNYAFRHALEASADESTFATKKGIGLKTLLLTLLMVASAVLMMSNFNRLGVYALIIYLGVALANVVFQIIICFVPRSTKVLAIPYSILEGLMIGTLVGLVELAMPGEGIGLAGLALILTIAIFLAASILYLTGVIRPDRKFRNFILCVCLGIFLTYSIVKIISIFNYDFYFQMMNSNIGFAVSIILTILAGIYVVISLDNANEIAENYCSKDCEWFAAYGILINVEWLFLQVFSSLIRLSNSKRN